MSKTLAFLAKGFEKHQWFRRGLVIVTLVLVIRMTHWSMGFAEAALLAKQSLLDTAALVTAVGALPVGILTLLYNKYSEGRNVSDDT
jgi:hypothetical protein